MSDPTYDKGIIFSNPVWKIAWVLSEAKNDNAPLGWSAYIPEAELLYKDEMKRKKKADQRIKNDKA